MSMPIGQCLYGYPIIMSQQRSVVIYTNIVYTNIDFHPHSLNLL